MLSLSYYSIGVMQHMIMEVLIGKILFLHRKSNQNKITIGKLEQHVELMGHIFRNEYNDRDTRPHSVMLR